MHKFYGKLGSAVMKWLPGRRDPAKEEADYIKAEAALVMTTLGEIYTKLELVERTATPVLRSELEPVLAGPERRRAFDEVQARLAATPLLTETYRRAIAGELERFETEHPRMMRAIEWGLVATAVIRPAISIGMFGAADVATHSLLHVGTHSVGQIFFDVAAGTAATAGGEGALATLAAPCAKLDHQALRRILQGACGAAGQDDSRLCSGPAPGAHRPACRARRGRRFQDGIPPGRRAFT